MKTLIFAVGLLFAVAASSRSEDAATKHPADRFSIHEAIKASEEHLKEQEQDTSRHFISAARFYSSRKTRVGEGPCWQVTYELKEGADGGQYFVFVYTDGRIGYLRGR